jgi:hypothetical protein
MPYKHNADRKHKYEKPCYKVTNWPDYKLNRVLILL